MSTICKNCGNVFEGNYCNNCGQKAETHAIDASFVAHDLQHGLFHFEGGMVYSAKELFTRPGNSIREYIEGKRKRHYKPISMLIVIATFYGVLYHLMDIDIFVQIQDEKLVDYQMFNEWIAHHFSIITLVLLPILAFTSHLLFKKQGYNFTEHLILNSFYSCQKLFIRVLLLPVFLLLEPETIVIVMRWLLIIDLFLMFWTYMQFFNEIPKLKVFLLVVLANAINLVLVGILITVFLASFLAFSN